MIEREAMVKISSELLANLLGGTKAANPTAGSAHPARIRSSMKSGTARPVRREKGEVK